MNDQISQECTKSSNSSLDNLAQKTHASFDMAVFLTVASSILYILGWTYWTQYFKYFGIDPSFIDLSFHQLIATTWWFAYSFALIIYAVIDHDGQESMGRVSISGYNFLLAVFALLSGFLFTLLIPLWLKITIAVALFLLLMVCKPKLKQKKLNLDKKLSGISGKIAFSMLLLSLALLLNIHLGNRHAKGKVELNGNVDRISIEVKGNTQPPKQAVLIAHMKGKYFICMPKKEGAKPETIIINDDVVERATILTAD